MRMRSTIVGAAVVAAVVAPGAAAAAASSAATFADGSATSAVRDHISSYFDSWKNDGQRAAGLADGGKSLVRFSVDKPSRAKSVGAISGLAGDTNLVGIDYRVQNGKLYGVGNAGGLYVISADNAKASKVGQLSVALTGTLFGVDFNPAANALRVVSNSGQNLRQPFGADDAPMGATVADTSLTRGGTAVTGVSAAAYTNNDLSPETATTLFDIDTALDQVDIQSPANNGTLAPTGMLGVAAGDDAGFDIYSDLRDGRTVEVTGFATLSAGGSTALYEVDLLNGMADRIGRFPVAVTDIAVELDRR